MLKKNRKSLKRGNTILLTLDKNKVLTMVGAFFCCLQVDYNQQNVIELHSEIIVMDRPGNVACFDLKIEHVKIHRNNEKNGVLNQ